jgi:DNA-binding response OmpR family regulator
MEDEKKRILVVDDELPILASIQIMLEDANYEVMTTSVGEDVEHLRWQARPDLILLDMLLTGTDGREIIKQMKSRKETRDIPIILLSAHPSGETEASIYGADDFLAKPFEIDELLSIIEKHV